MSAGTVAATRQGSSPQKIRKSVRVRPGKTIAWFLVAATIIATIFPFYWMIRTALTPAGGLVADASLLWPTDPTLINFQRVLGLTSIEEAVAAGGSGASIDFVRYTINSVIYAGSVAIVQTLSCAAAAYAFARLKFPGRDVLFGVILAGLMIPGIFTLLPNFALLRELELLNTMFGLVAPALLMSPFTIFFLRQFFLSLPQDVEEAAMIDGVGSLGRFWRIALPMSRGPIATMMLITLVGMWKDYLWPLVAGNSEFTRLLTVALSVFQQQSPNTSPDWTGLMAGATLSVLPVLLILIFLGKQLVQSLNFSGGK
ncbi:carbohydrate ABC transporter permease [Microbacterium sp. W4I20]|uniref:carbohydrate ABC transporter permease n=1 Tax=Microbacterium sp. W4I20 TaxID=3042262 RepID=UPI00278A6BDC|nr:carbohydrate ABC transporter permease [Microbacterium sp. W4I20]MDQ0727371.1 multiple sugar transport system permease protein [Microbacterium sp. W4I20]